MEKIGIIGSGDVAQRLGAGLAAAGHEVKLGTRDPKKLADWIKEAGPRASAGSFAEAAQFGDVVFVCTLWTGTKSALELAGAERLAGKVVVDVTNPLDFGKGMPPTLSVSGNDSSGETVQRWLPGSKVVKAFNYVGNAHMVKPEFPGARPDLFLAGNDEGAKKKVDQLGRELGWGPAIDLGGIDASRYLESLAMVWILYFARTGKADHALALLRK